MFIHIGERKTVSDEVVIGIFNIDTIRKSEINDKIVEKCMDLQCDIKTIVIDMKNTIISSKVSPYTIIKRYSLDDSDFVWRKK